MEGYLLGSIICNIENENLEEVKILGFESFGDGYLSDFSESKASQVNCCHIGIYVRIALH